MLLMAVVALYLRFRKKLYDTKWFLQASILSAPLDLLHSGVAGLRQKWAGSPG